MPNFIQKLLLWLIAILSFLPLFALAAPSLLLIENAPNEYQLPRHFRSTDHLTGASNLHLMGSAQFSEANLQYVLAHYPKPAYIFDIRQESHGFVNGIAISWYGKYNWANLNNSASKNQKIENELLNDLKSKEKIVINQVVDKENGDIGKTLPITIQVKNVSNEQQLVEKQGIKYVRIYVPDHHPPSDQQVDEFVKLIKDLPSSSWLYLHCKGGKGRTTTFMAMIDIMRNAKNSSFEDIIARQYAIGGINLAKKKVNKPSVLLQKADDRLEFLQKFYVYARDNNDKFKSGWQK